eukprot:Gb_12833 [translate_table: standard]
MDGFGDMQQYLCGSGDMQRFSKDYSSDKQVQENANFQQDESFSGADKDEDNSEKREDSSKENENNNKFHNAKDKELQSYGKRRTTTHQENFPLVISLLEAKEPTSFIEALLDKENVIGSNGSKNAEADTLEMVRHKNIVSNHSNFCVYKYMPNGNLFNALLKNNGEKAFEGETKSTNILPNEFYEEKIVDFGVTKILQVCGGGKDSYTIFASTHGYIISECAQFFKVKEKRYTYSLLELEMGRDRRQVKEVHKRGLVIGLPQTHDIFVLWLCCKMGILQGSLEDHGSLVAAVKQVDIVISCVGVQISDQLRIIDAIKQVGTIKISTFEIQKRYVQGPSSRTCEGLFGYFLANLVQPGLTAPPRDKVVIYGDGNAKAVMMKEEDIATYTIKAVDDPRTLNKTLYLRRSANTKSQNELVALWEHKIGKALEKVILPEEQLQQIQDTPFPNNIVLSIVHDIFARGDQCNFEIGENGVEGSQLYLEVNYTTVDEYFNKFVQSCQCTLEFW